MGKSVDYEWIRWVPDHSIVTKVKMHKRGGVYVSFNIDEEGLVEFRLPKHHVKWMKDIVRMYKKAEKEATK